MNPFQGTVGKTIEIVGVGLHSGKLVRMEVLPASPYYGIRFLRTDIPGASPLLAHPFHISSTTLCTSISDGVQTISTIEHFMAALAGLGVDNALVKVNAPELPIMDGSAAPFVDRLLDVGIQRQPEHRPILPVTRRVEVSHGEQTMVFDPWEIGSKKHGTLVISCTIDFQNSLAIGHQTLEVEWNFDTFLKLSDARTFCHIDDINQMRSQGLALGGSLDNAVVVNNSSVINNDGLRYQDEFVRHKILDCMGDLSLLPGRLSGRLSTFKAGHSLHAQFTKKIAHALQSSYNVENLPQRGRRAV
jgi:UDP-3-O-[3-hydroxymyristoyl] N-acetylglucosamine deacetylase